MNKLLKLIFTSLLVASVTLTGCSNSNSEKKDTEKKTTVSKEDQKPQKEEEQKQDDKKAENDENKEDVEGQAVVSDNWEDIEISINGVVYEFPYSYREFEKNGWQFVEGDRNTTLPLAAGAYLLSPIGLKYHSDTTEPAISSVGCNIMNLTQEDLDPKDCQIRDIRINSNQDALKTNKDLVKLAKNITFGSTKKEIIKAYGKPQKTTKETAHHLKERGISYHLEYEGSNRSHMILSMDESDKLIDLRIYRKIRERGF